jgi:hypothetical protein
LFNEQKSNQLSAKLDYSLAAHSKAIAEIEKSHKALGLLIADGSPKVGR